MSRVAETMLIIFVTLNLCSGLGAEPAEDSADEAAMQAAELEPAGKNEDEKDKVRLAAVRTISFYLRSGRLVTGRLISEDKNQITVEELDESKIFVSTYSKKEIDSRTMRQTKMPELKYYLDLAEYFESRIWDFRDDPDDFVQAMRFYEKAREIIEQSQERVPTSAEEIEEKLKQLREQKDLWAKEVKKRAELKRLEFEATFDVRLDEINNEVDGLAQALREMGERLDGLAKRKQDNYKKIENRLSKMDRSTNAKLKELEARIEMNEREIDRLWRRRYRYNLRPYYRVPRENDGSSK